MKVSRYSVFPAAMLMFSSAVVGAVGPVSGAEAQQSSQTVRMSPICSCSDRPRNVRHARQIMAACDGIASDADQPASRRLEAMKRRLRISELVQR